MGVRRRVRRGCERVRAVLQRIINADSRILDTPAPLIVLGSLSASSVDITVRVWVKAPTTGVYCTISTKSSTRHLMKKASDSRSRNSPYTSRKSKKQRMFPKHSILPQSGNILFKYPLQISPARFRPGTGSFLSAGKYLPCPGTQHRTDKRAYNEIHNWLKASPP